MDFRIFAHSWLSDWNHGNAHFLRGLACALQRRGHGVLAYEEFPTPRGGWSLAHLREDHPEQAPGWIAGVRAAYAELDVRAYTQATVDWGAELRGATHVVVHEWHPPELFQALLEQRRRYGFRMMLLDTHHRMVSDRAAIERLPWREMDGVLAFGESLRRQYEAAGRGCRTFGFQEAADERHFHPGWRDGATDQELVWIGNWGDEERTREIDEFLLGPAERMRGQARTRVFGVRYPDTALAKLEAAGIGWGGYLPNLQAPEVYGRSAVTVHIPRRPYVEALPGIPTIRVFEALACGIALVTAPWQDSEGLFEAGRDYWVAQDGREMTSLLKQLLRNPTQRRTLEQNGRAVILSRHTCGHRAAQLEEICRELQ